MTGLSRRAAAEFLGTAFLLAAVVGSGIMAAKLAGGNGALALLCNTLPTGAILAVLILIFGPVSGAHFNPVVTLAFVFAARIRDRAPVRSISRLNSPARSSALGRALMFDLALSRFRPPRASVSGNGLPKGSRPSAWCWRSSAASSRRLPRPRGGGSLHHRGLWFTASTSFANPAVTIARSLSDTFAGISPSGVPAFIAAQFAGALAATLLATWLWKTATDR